jgi:hypothetical protein
MHCENASPPQQASSFYRPELRELIDHGHARIEFDLRRTAPFLCEKVSDWMMRLSPTGETRDYLTQPRMFPTLLLPWWMAKSFDLELDTAFQADVIYSSLNGYYYIRLLDNLMDGHSSTELKILPATAFFQSQFQLAYQPYFEAGHTFWRVFQNEWFSSAEAVAREVDLEYIGIPEFEQVSVKKVCAVKIPLAATAYRYEKSSQIQHWWRFAEALAGWAQMLDDLFDWHQDLRNRKISHFLSLANQSKEPEESIESWVLREGFKLGVCDLQRCFPELRRIARGLHSAEVEYYLDVREEMLAEDAGRIGAGLSTLREIATILGTEGGKMQAE